MNITRIKKYADNLDFDAYSRAMLTGIALGWVQTRGGYTGEQDMIAACAECDFCVRVRWRSGKPEVECEGLLLKRMASEARGRGCPHWRKFVEYLYEGGLHWHNWVPDESTTYPSLRLSTHAERMQLRPRSGYGQKAKELVDAMAVAQCAIQAVK